MVTPIKKPRTFMVTGVVCQLCTANNSFINGQIIRVNGGRMTY